MATFIPATAEVRMGWTPVSGCLVMLVLGGGTRESCRLVTCFTVCLGLPLCPIAGQVEHVMKPWACLWGASACPGAFLLSHNLTVNQFPSKRS